MNNQNKEKLGPFVPREDIAFWYPVSIEEAALISKYQQHLRKTEGYAPPSFQTMSRAMRAHINKEIDGNN